MSAPLFIALLFTGAAALALSGCATSPAPTPDSALADGWHDVGLPGKAHTLYTSAQKDGRPCTAAISVV